jgi:hypothetical protein
MIAFGRRDFHLLSLQTLEKPVMDRETGSSERTCIFVVSLSKEGS